MTSKESIERSNSIQAAIAKAHEDARQGYRIEENKQYGSKEIYFTGIPSLQVRESLKALKFKWHGIKKCWYGFADEARIREACGDVLVLPATKTVEHGTLYEGWEGGNCRSWHSDQELKQFILADLKKLGIKASIRFKKAGYLTSFVMTLTLKKDMVKSFEVWEADYNFFSKSSFGWVYYIDDNGVQKDIHREQLLDLESSDPERFKKIIESAKKVAYENAVRNLSSSNCYFGGGLDILTEEGNNILDSAHAVVSSYNHDQSNSMIDYFDRSIYDDYSIKIA